MDVALNQLAQACDVVRNGCCDVSAGLAVILVTRHRRNGDRGKPGKSKGARTSPGQINAAPFNIGPSVRDRDRHGTTVLLVGDLDFGTEGQRLVRRRHRIIAERDTAGGFGSSL